MIGRYCFSFDRETFTGDFETRQAALDESFRLAAEIRDTPPSVFIGQRETLEPGATGHSETVIDRMRRSVFEAVGEPGSDYLAAVGEHEQADLDDALATAIRAWLLKHHLLPRSTRVTGISEHPIPTRSASKRASEEREVTEIGSAEYA